MRILILLLLTFSATQVHAWDKPRKSWQQLRNSYLSSTNLAPDPNTHPEAVIQVYGARTWGKKGIFAVHTWLSFKERGADAYTRNEVIGWGLKRRGTSVVERVGVGDGQWYGETPSLILDLRGFEAEKLIPKIKQAISDYPYADQYRAWPGPNSNTFTAFIGHQVPELGLDLPSTAIGKDYQTLSGIIGRSSSGSGLQLSLFGLVGANMGYEEGLELNLLGLHFELDIFDLAVELPLIGRIGLPQ